MQRTLHKENGVIAMTDGKTPSIDHFPTVLEECRYIVAVIFPHVLETSDENLTQEIDRGIYHFTAFKAARAFVTACNSGLDEPVAYLFRNKNTLNDPVTTL